LSDEPKYEWHTLNSVSFDVTAIYLERTNDIGGRERIARTLRIMIYREHPKADWKNLLSTDGGRKIL
jgi:hypothetical protein